MTVATRGRNPLTSGFIGLRLAARTETLLTASTAVGLMSIAGIFGVAVWAVATR